MERTDIPLMEVPQILRQFEKCTGAFPFDAVAAAVARRDEIIPELLYILEETAEDVSNGEQDWDRMAHVYATYLLGQFRERRALKRLIRLFSFSKNAMDGLWGDGLTEDGGRMLASVCGGDLKPIMGLIEDPNAYIYARAAGFAAIVTAVGAGLVPRQAAVDYFASLFRGQLPREPSFVWDELVLHACQIWPGELVDDIRQAYADDLVDVRYVSQDEFEEYLENGLDMQMSKLADVQYHRLVEDTAKEMSYWDCFQEKLETPRTQPARVQKTGRNEPCPCGSGKKYKKCCGK